MPVRRWPVGRSPGPLPMPAGVHAWRFGEPERLMAPLFYLARRAWWTAADWQAWFEALTAQRARPAQPTAESLAQRHNLGAFLSALRQAIKALD